MDLKNIYRTALSGNKPVKVDISITYQDGTTSRVLYSPAGITERYGTNPHQLFALLGPENYTFRMTQVKSGKSGFSLTNIEDAYWLVEFIAEREYCVVLTRR